MLLWLPLGATLLSAVTTGLPAASRPCGEPQYSAQKTVSGSSSAVVCVASNHSVVNMPGTTSRFTRKAGTKKLCSTSAEDMVKRTGWCTGTVSALDS